MTNKQPSLTKLVNNLYRFNQSYTNDVLAKYQLSCGTYPFLLTLFEREGINQNQISRELNIDKAMSARAVKKLIKLGYLVKEEDIDDSRAFKLFLTDKSREVIPYVKEDIKKWNEILTGNLYEDEREKIIEMLNRVLENAKKYKKINLGKLLL